MKKLIYFILLILPVTVYAQEIESTGQTDVRVVESPDNRVAVLELYTSEGCSSCPPADHFLSNLRETGISSKHLIPMAFHVTYWDYIGWNDRYAKKQYDTRQRELALKQQSNTVYTPQFVLSGDDYRRYSNFNKDVSELVKQKATVSLSLSMQTVFSEAGQDKLSLILSSDISKSKAKDIGLYFVVIENDLTSDVNAGENSGKELNHDYVVRQLSGPYYQRNDETKKEKIKSIVLHPDWQRDNLSVVAFAENVRTGEVLQAVRIKY